jgi:superfamily II DNA or RNA helicase
MHSDDNMVVSSPTGSGKTVIFELAIIRLLEASAFDKAVYLAPTKSLCAERARDWTAKFAGIGVKCGSHASSPVDTKSDFFFYLHRSQRRRNDERHGVEPPIVPTAARRACPHLHA